MFYCYLLQFRFYYLYFYFSVYVFFFNFMYLLDGAWQGDFAIGVSYSVPVPVLAVPIHLCVFQLLSVSFSIIKNKHGEQKIFISPIKSPKIN